MIDKAGETLLILGIPVGLTGLRQDSRQNCRHLRE